MNSNRMATKVKDKIQTIDIHDLAHGAVLNILLTEDAHTSLQSMGKDAGRGVDLSVFDPSDNDLVKIINAATTRLVSRI